MSEQPRRLTVAWLREQDPELILEADRKLFSTEPQRARPSGEFHSWDAVRLAVNEGKVKRLCEGVESIQRANGGRVVEDHGAGPSKEIDLDDLPPILSATIGEVEAGARILLTKYQKPAAVLVPVADFARLRTKVDPSCTLQTLLSWRVRELPLEELCAGDERLLASCEDALLIIGGMERANDGRAAP